MSGSVGGGSGGSFAAMVYRRPNNGSSEVVYSRNLTLTEGDGFINCYFEIPCTEDKYVVNVTTNNYFQDIDLNPIPISIKVPYLNMSSTGFKVDFSSKFSVSSGDDMIYINVVY